MNVQRVLVVGAGVMGNGIAQVVATAGFDVTLVDVDGAALERALARIERSLGKLVDSERMSGAEAEAARRRLTLTTELEPAAEAADHVIEAVVESFDVKADVLRRLDGRCRDEVVVASNTSQFSVSRLAAVTGRPDRVIGSHWFNPPPVMKLIELVRGVETSEETLELAVALAERYGKRTIVCEKDTPGFITSRLIVALALEAARIVEEGIASADDVDTACVLAFNHRMGPLDTIDYTGLDTALYVADNLRDQYGDRYLAPQNLRALVAAGHIGRKSGRGFKGYGEAA